MSNNLSNSALLIVPLAMILVACDTTPATSASVDRVLMLPTVDNAPYSNVLVVGATPSRETDRNIEEGLTRELRLHDVQAHSFVRESSSNVPSEEAIAQFVDDEGVDGVIVVSAKFEGIELTTHDEQVDIQADVRGGGLLDYFRYDYKETKSPAYSDVTLDVVFVSDLYDTETDRRVYSVESSSAHGQTDYQIIIAESKAIVRRLVKDGLIR